MQSFLSEHSSISILCVCEKVIPWRDCTFSCSSEPSLLTDAINTNIPCTGPNCSLFGYATLGLLIFSDFLILGT